MHNHPVCLGYNQSPDPGCQFPNCQYDNIFHWWNFNPSITNKCFKAFCFPNQSQQYLKPSLSKHHYFSQCGSHCGSLCLYFSYGTVYTDLIAIACFLHMYMLVISVQVCIYVARWLVRFIDFMSANTTSPPPFPHSSKEHI